MPVFLLHFGLEILDNVHGPLVLALLDDDVLVFLIENPDGLLPVIPEEVVD